MCAPGLCYSIVPRALVVLRDAPLGGDEVPFLESMEGLVEGAVTDIERAIRSRFDPLRDLEAVHWRPAQSFEDEGVERAFDDGKGVLVGHGEELRQRVQSLTP